MLLSNLCQQQSCQRFHSQKNTKEKKQIKITKHLIWGTLDINLFEVLLKLDNAEVTLPTVVSVPVMDKYRDQSIMDNNDLISYIMLLTGVTWQTPNNFNAIVMQDINQSI